MADAERGAQGETRRARSDAGCENRRITPPHQVLADNTAANELPPIRQLSAPELKALIESGAPFELVDVRTDQERALATIDGARLLDQAYHDALLQLDRDTRIVFQCHHGIRSQHAAEYFRGLGFRNLHNLRGGIEAWSQLVDAAVPRY
jgi:monothiol glutaredoxin